MVFTYGTLLSKLVLQAVLGRIPERADATLQGYRRYAIEGQCYPAVVPTKCSDDAVQGKVLLGITKDELRILDKFEDPAYDRVQVRVSVVGRSERPLLARVWARPAENAGDLSGEWSLTRFEAENEDWYAVQCKEWADGDQNGL